VETSKHSGHILKTAPPYNGWSDTDKLAHLKAALIGHAGQVLWDSDTSAVNTLSKLVELLKNRFGGIRQEISTGWNFAYATEEGMKHFLTYIETYVG